MISFKSFQNLPTTIATLTAARREKMLAEALARRDVYAQAIALLRPPLDVTMLRAAFAGVLVQGDVYTQRLQLLQQLAQDGHPDRLVLGLLVREAQRYHGTYRSATGHVERLVFTSRTEGAAYLVALRAAVTRIKG